MPNYPRYNDSTKLFTDAKSEDAAKSWNLLRNITHTAEFFQTRIAQGFATRNDSHTHIGLMESYLKELAALVQYDLVRDEEKELQTQYIRELSETNRRLVAALGSDITADTLYTGIQHYTRLIEIWGKLHGFQYLHIEHLNYGLKIRTDDDLMQDAKSQFQAPSILNDLYQNLRPAYPLISKDTTRGWDILRQDYIDKLLHTDRNRENLKAIIEEDFPKSVIWEFHSRKTDDGEYALQCTAIIPFADLENFEKKHRTNKEGESCGQK